jgi:hypothetical protein
MLIAIYSIAAVAGLIVLVTISRACRNRSIDLQYGFRLLKDRGDTNCVECQIFSRPTTIRCLEMLERRCIEANPALSDEELGELLDKLAEWAKARGIGICILTETEPVRPTGASVERLWRTSCGREDYPGGEVERAVHKLEAILRTASHIVPIEILQRMTRANKSVELQYIDTCKDYPPYEQRWRLDLSHIIELAQQELARRQVSSRPAEVAVASTIPKLVTEFRSKK